MKRKITFFILMMTLSAASAHSFIREGRPRFEPPATYPAEVQGLRYLKGLIRTDVDTYGTMAQPKVSAKFSKKDFALMRKRIDQGTLNDKARKIESVEIIKIPYKKILGVWYGDEAVRNLEVMALPSQASGGEHGLREVLLDQRYYAPVVIVYKQSRKKKATIVVMGPNDKSWATYTLLTRQRNRFAKGR